MWKICTLACKWRHACQPVRNPNCFVSWEVDIRIKKAINQVCGGRRVETTRTKRNIEHVELRTQQFQWPTELWPLRLVTWLRAEKIELFPCENYFHSFNWVSSEGLIVYFVSTPECRNDLNCIVCSSRRQIRMLSMLNEKKILIYHL